MSGRRRLLVLNGPNLDQLGSREPDVYGTATLEDVVATARARAEAAGWQLEHLQTADEGELVAALHDARGRFDGVVLNAGAWTHTSVAIRDAVAASGMPVVEVHLSNVHGRERLRHTSVITAACLGVVAGFGVTSYALAVEALVAHVRQAEQDRG